MNLNIKQLAIGADLCPAPDLHKGRGCGGRLGLCGGGGGGQERGG